jgi:hypothetical protein
MDKPPRHERQGARWGPSLGFLAIAFALVAGALAGAWSSMASSSAASDAASAPAAAASAPPLQLAEAAASVPALARVTPAGAAAAPASPQIPRHRDPDGDQTPDIADYINAGENPTMNEVLDRLHQAGVHTGLGAFNPPGTKPPLIGLAVPEDFALPPGYVRHYQATDDGQRIEPILMFAPDYQATGPDGRPVAMPANRVVPPELAPPGLPLRRIVVPAPVAGP